VAVAVGRSAIVTSDSLSPTPMIAPTSPPGLWAQMTKGSRSRSARNLPSESAVTVNGLTQPRLHHATVLPAISSPATNFDLSGVQIRIPQRVSS
jgi:hypothetical protein